MSEDAQKALFDAMKAVDTDAPETVMHAKFCKIDEDQRIVWGWASVVSVDGKALVDLDDDIISPAEMTKGADEFMLSSRTVKEMHSGKRIGEVFHSMPLTKELGAALGVHSRREGWITALKIHSDAVWAKVKSGELGGISISGRWDRNAA